MRPQKWPLVIIGQRKRGGVDRVQIFRDTVELVCRVLKTSEGLICARSVVTCPAFK